MFFGKTIRGAVGKWLQASALTMQPETQGAPCVLDALIQERTEVERLVVFRILFAQLRAELFPIFLAHP
jgi:hypothetical protein